MAPPALPSALLNFDIDIYLNPFVPAPRLTRLPECVSRFLGYRAAPPPPQPRLVIWFWAFIGAFCGIGLIEGVALVSPWVQAMQAPLIVGSYGAAAILEFNTIDSPLSQPRNMIMGQFLSATLGVCITKLFALLPAARFEALRWLVGALSVAMASLVMSVTQTIHPPAGATALLAATDPVITNLGWNYIPLVLLSDVLMLGSALLLNNIARRFPLYFWTPSPLAKKIMHFEEGGVDGEREDESKEESESKDESNDESKADGDARPDTRDETSAREENKTAVENKHAQHASHDHDGIAVTSTPTPSTPRAGRSAGPSAGPSASASTTSFEDAPETLPRPAHHHRSAPHPFEISITPDCILVPTWLALEDVGSAMLRTIQAQLREGARAASHTAGGSDHHHSEGIH